MEAPVVRMERVVDMGESSESCCSPGLIPVTNVLSVGVAKHYGFPFLLLIGPIFEVD